MKLIEVNLDNCTGCRACETICSLQHEQECSTTRSRIKILKDQEFGNHLVAVCAQCSKAYCVEICPTSALHRDDQTGAVLVEDGLCHGCETCLAVCPLDAISFDKENNVAMVCDLCNGDPECVEVCTHEALVVADVDYASPARMSSIERMSNLLLTMRSASQHN